MATVEQTTMKVQRILTGPMGLQISLRDDRFIVQFSDVSTVAHVQVRDGGTDSEGETKTYVLVTAPILFEITPTPALFEWVAREGGSNWFGHVEVHDTDGSGKVYLMMAHTLLGDYLDEPELSAAVYGVLGAADSWDDELQKRFGGKRTADD